MTKVQYFTACTLDGFIADEHNSLDWLFEVPHEVAEGQAEGVEGDWDAFIGGVGVLVMGATTYEWMVEHHDMTAGPEQWREFYGDRPGWVFSHREMPEIPGVDIHVVSGDVRPVYDEVAAAAGGRNIWVLGGGALVGQFDDAGLLDEVWLGLTPVTLGTGAPLLPRRITSERLRLREVRRTGQRVRLVLDVAPRR